MSPMSGPGGDRNASASGMDRQAILHRLLDLFAFKAAYQSESSGLRGQDMQLLERLARGKRLNTLALAHQCGLAPATAIAVLDRLQAQGYLRRTRDRRDRRAVKVSLTAAGEELVARHLAEDAAFADNLLARLPADDAAQLERLLAQLLFACDDDLSGLFQVSDPAPRLPAKAPSGATDGVSDD